VDFDDFDPNAHLPSQRRKYRAKTIYMCADKNLAISVDESDETRPDGREWKINFNEEVDIMEIPSREESVYADWDEVDHDATFLQRIKRRLSRKDNRPPEARKSILKRKDQERTDL